MATYPLSISSKGQNKRKIEIADASDAVLAYGEVPIARVHRKPTTLYADKKKTQEMAVLTPTLEKKVLTFEVSQPGGATVGSLRLEGGFTSREFELFDASGNSVGRISGEGIGREMAGAALGGLAGAAMGRASYHVTMQSGASVEISRKGRRKAFVDKNGEIPPDQEQLLLATLVMWAAYGLM
jgi:hypothetical protein